MLSLGASNDKNLLNSLHNAIFGVDMEGSVGYLLYVADKPIGVAKLRVTPEEMHIIEVGLLEEYRGKGYGDFFTRSLMNIFIDVTDYIYSDYLDDYFLKFGFERKGDVMVVESDKLTFPRKCQCGH
ncbi:MAG: GNAT family N-acetyltransferase [Clostridia bacterium]|nr:GNAT family N-acetyltransferase [Clostridia bacterium]